jgi:hypothetical protein
MNQLQAAPTETELAARAVAPRVSQADVDVAVMSAAYYVFPDTMLTVCCLTLRNGFTVTGESACASPANYQKDIGERIARENAYNKVWALLGYQLRVQMQASSIEAVARVCHEINRAYCAALGDNSQPAWEDAPEWQKGSARAGVRMHMDNPNAGPEASHEAWMAQKLADGWVLGPFKDPERKTHPCLVPFDLLPRDQQAKDYLFRATVHALAPVSTATAAAPVVTREAVDTGPLVITPTVGRVVWYYPAADDPYVTRDGDQPMSASVAFVHDDRHVNLAVFDHAGLAHAYPKVQLVQEGDAFDPNGARCTWMPYQMGQARKT